MTNPTPPSNPTPTPFPPHPGPTHPTPTGPGRAWAGHLPIGAQTPARLSSTSESAEVRVGGPPASDAGARPVMPKARRWRGFDEIPGTAEIAAGINASLNRRH